MIWHKAFLLWAGVGLLASGAVAQAADWETAFNAGTEALMADRYADAEKHLTSGLRAAETFAANDERRWAALRNLGWLYQLQARHGEAEPLLRQAVGLLERLRGPDHEDLLAPLDLLGEVYTAQGK